MEANQEEISWEEKMKNIKYRPSTVLIIGAGGIGSMFVEHINKMVMNDQIPIDIEFEIVDNDKVELKNIKYQNFIEEDVLKPKVSVLEERYGFLGTKKKITKDEDLTEYEAIIIAVDNAKARKLVYDHCFANDKWFLDMRAEGRQVAIITSDTGQKEALDTLPQHIKDKSGSCQLKYEFEQGIIQYGNVIVASMGAQIFLNKIRGDKFNPKIIMRV